MAYQIPYHQHKGFRPLNDLMPGNDQSDNPVEFDLAPAWGPDLARVRSIIAGSLGLVNDQDWSGPVQDAVIASLQRGADAFVNTVDAVRGLTVPAIMAVRAGIIQELPKRPGTNDVDPQAPVPITTGFAFSRIAGAVPAMALHVATKIAEISQQAEKVADPRFFVQPSGSGGTGTPEAKGSTAGSAPATSRRRGTAGSGSRKAK